MDSILFWLVPVASVLALCFAYYFHKQMMKESEGTPQMIKIAAAVRKGAMSYLKQQYKIVGCVFLGLVILFSIMAYGFHVQNAWVPIAFLTGGFFSGLSGFLGMKTATCPYGRIPEIHGYPLKMTEIAATLEGTCYVTRQSVHSVPAIRKAKKAIRKAFENSMQGKGSNLVEIVSTCNSGWKMSPDAANKWMVENMFPFYPIGDLKDTSENK